MAMNATNIDLVQDGLMRISDAAAFTGLSRSTLYEMMEQGELVYVKIGRARRIPRRALVELAAAHLKGGWRATTNQVPGSDGRA